jgi:hypothetical protein
MKRVVSVLALSCVLSVSAFAGDVPSVPGPQPPPDQLQGQTITGVSNLSPTNDSEEATARAIVEALQAMLSLLAF